MDIPGIANIFFDFFNIDKIMVVQERIRAGTPPVGFRSEPTGGPMYAIRTHRWTDICDLGIQGSWNLSRADYLHLLSSLVHRSYIK